MIKTKSVFLCLSGNGGLNVSSIKRFIDLIASFGYTGIELGLDDMIKVDDEPYYGYLRGGYSIEELKEIDEYAKSKNIEAIPSCQFLGHFDYLCKIPEYDEIIDIDSILLAEENRTYELIDHMFKSLRKAFSTNKINIAFDEAHHVGLGKYLDKHGYKNRFDILVNHLNKVVEIASRYNFDCHMWSDMFFKLQNKGIYYDKNVTFSDEVKSKIPSNVGLVYWDYYNKDVELLDSMLRSHLQLGRELYFAGSVFTFNGFAPANIASIDMLKVQIGEARKFGITNYLITLWGDDGNDCSYFASLPGLFVASLLIDGKCLDDFELHRFKKITGVDFDTFLLLDEPNRSKLNPDLKQMNVTCKSLFYNDPFLGWKDFELEKILPIDYLGMAKKYEKVLPYISSEYKLLFKKNRDLCLFLSKKYDLGIRLRKAYKDKNLEELRNISSSIEGMLTDLDNFTVSFREAWMNEFKPHGFDIHLIRLGGLCFRLKEVRLRINDFLDKKIDRIEELDEMLLKYAKFDSAYNKYSGFATIRNI